MQKKKKMTKSPSPSTVYSDIATDEKYGKPYSYDPEFKGPIKNRSCTDVICLCLFVCFIAGWIVVAAFAYSQGHPETLIFPTDSGGRICGVGELESRPYLYFFDLSRCANPMVLYNGCPTPQVCVEKCPSETFLSTPNRMDDIICKDNVNKNSNNIIDLVKNEDCAPFQLKSTPLIGRCIPSFANTSEILQVAKEAKFNSSLLETGIKNIAELLNARQVGEKIFQDFKTSWHLMLLGLVLAMMLSFLWIIMMRWVAGIMVYLSIICVIGLSAFASYYSFSTYKELQQSEQKDVHFKFTTNVKSYLAMKKTWLAFGIFATIVLVVLLLVLIFLRKRIRIAIALIREASKALRYMMSSLFFPLIPYLLHLALLTFWATVAIYIASTNKSTYMAYNENKEPLNQTCNETLQVKSDKIKCIFKEYADNRALSYAQLYNLFGLFWSLFFVVGVGQVSLAGAFASYYWTYNKPHDIPSNAVASGTWRCIRYHLGSVAFGSLILAIIRFIRVILEYIDQKCKRYDNKFTKVILCICKCCFWCLEKFMKFINKNAYIMIAVYGKNFCVSAKNAFCLLMRNIVRVVVLDKVTDFLLLIGKLMVVGATAVASFYFFTGKITYLSERVPTLNYNLLPVITVTFGAYVIATGFFSVYGMAVDTLFLCFLEDCERNDGSSEKPYYMSCELMKILGKKNKFRDPNEK